MPRAEEIKSAIQLLVEGNDPRNFFEAFVEHLSLANIQIQNFGGIYELRGFLSALVNAPGFQIVQSIGIVRDAETSAVEGIPKCSVFVGESRVAYAGQPRRTH